MSPEQTYTTTWANTHPLVTPPSLAPKTLAHAHAFSHTPHPATHSLLPLTCPCVQLQRHHLVTAANQSLRSLRRCAHTPVAFIITQHPGLPGRVLRGYFLYTVEAVAAPHPPSRILSPRYRLGVIPAAPDHGTSLQPQSKGEHLCPGHLFADCPAQRLFTLPPFSQCPPGEPSSSDLSVTPRACGYFEPRPRTRPQGSAFSPTPPSGVCR